MCVSSRWHKKKTGSALMRISNKLWVYFVLGGVIGPFIVTLLLSLERALFRIDYFLSITYIFPFAMLLGFIPFGLLGLFALLLIRKYYQVLSSRKIILFLSILGGVYGIVLCVLDLVLWICIPSIHKPIANIASYIGTVIYKIFSSLYAGWGYLPPTQNYSVVSAVLISSITSCLLLLFIFQKTTDENIPGSNQKEK